jgi:hypothetical protein
MADNRRIRIICPVCGSWMEHDQKGFMDMFIEGFEPDSPEAKAWVENRQRAVPFIAKHLQCCKGHAQGLRFVYEDNPAFRLLPAEKQFIPPIERPASGVSGIDSERAHAESAKP